MEHLLYCSDIFYGLTRKEVRKMAYDFAGEISVDIPELWKKNMSASYKWFYGFMRRNKMMRMRKPEQTSRNRATAFSKENVASFFKNYSKVFEKNAYTGKQIWNMDETAFLTVPTKVGLVVARKGVRQVSVLTAQERGNLVTMAFAVSASGATIPPMFIFPRKNMQKIFMEHAPEGSIGFATPSGWTEENIFIKWMDHFIENVKPTAESPVILFLDNHESHISLTAMNQAREHHIEVLSFPPHCSHKLQPLDVSVFGPVKTAYTVEYNNWTKSNANKDFEIHHIPKIVATILDANLTADVIKSGFRASGIWPYKENIFKDTDYSAYVLEKAQSKHLYSSENDDRRLTEIVILRSTNVDDADEAHIDDVTQENEDEFNEEVGAEIEVEISSYSESTSASRTPTPGPSPSPRPGPSHDVNLHAALEKVSPMKFVQPRKKSNRGRKPMKAMHLTSDESMKILQDKHNKKTEKLSQKENALQVKTGKAPKRQGSPKGFKKVGEATLPFKNTEVEPQQQAKRSKLTQKDQKKKTQKNKNESSDDEDVDFCIICMKSMPKKLTPKNSIACDQCGREVHLRCAHIISGYFTCSNCDSD